MLVSLTLNIQESNKKIFINLIFMNKPLVTIVLCIIAGVALYFLTPFIHYLLRWPSRIFIISILTYSFISVVIGISIAIVPFERKKPSSVWR